MRALAFAALFACSTMSPDRHWQLFDGEDLVLDVSSRPGPIRSVASLPQGAAPATSAFLSATSHDAGHEDQLHEILVASHSVDDFLARARAAGFTIVVQ